MPLALRSAELEHIIRQPPPAYPIQGAPQYAQMYTEYTRFLRHTAAVSSFIVRTVDKHYLAQLMRQTTARNTGIISLRIAQPVSGSLNPTRILVSGILNPTNCRIFVSGILKCKKFGCRLI